MQFFKGLYAHIKSECRCKTLFIFTVRINQKAMTKRYIYRPQRSWAKVIFSQACVCPQGGGCLPQCMLGYIPLGADTPPPPGADTLPPEQTPPTGSRHPPEQTPPRDADCSIRSTSGRYASYWNAFLLVMVNIREISFLTLTGIWSVTVGEMYFR